MALDVRRELQASEMRFRTGFAAGGWIWPMDTAAAPIMSGGSQPQRTMRPNGSPVGIVVAVFLSVKRSRAGIASRAAGPILPRASSW